MHRAIVLAAALFLSVAASASDPAIRFLALGDSYTEGTAVKAEQAWPAQVLRHLRHDGISVASALVIAREGWTTDELLSAVDAKNPQGPFDVVTVMIGVNDQFRGGSAAAFRPKLVQVVARAIALAGNRPGRVVLITIPDYSVTPFGQSRNPAETEKGVRDFNAVVVEISRLYGLRIADVTALSRRAAGNAELIAPDGLHPSERMHRAWAALIYTEIRKALAGGANSGRRRT